MWYNLRDVSLMPLGPRLLPIFEDQERRSRLVFRFFCHLLSMSNDLTRSVSNSFQQVVFVNKAICRDCYRCVRVCPVKAIKMHDSQASVIADRCISCGTCIRECPQSAKTFRNDLEIAMRLLSEGGRVACSLAPSFAGFFPSWQRRRIPSVLRRLGFSYVGETAIGAFYTAKATARYLERSSGREPGIVSACPACVDYIVRYQPQWARYIIPVVSPMIAHAKYIRRQFGPETKVVFIGPCVAKKVEGHNYTDDGRIDCVLTFDEFHQWLKDEHIEISGCEESDFDEHPRGAARYFPLEGGCVKTAGWTANMLDEKIIAVSGFANVKYSVEESRPGQIIEPLFCPHGCAGGPANGEKNEVFEARFNILEYAREELEAKSVDPRLAEDIEKDSILTQDEEQFLDRLFTRYEIPKLPKKKEVTEQQIRDVFEKTGKSLPEKQLNCGACGYPNCREMAIAVVEGIAESEMCVPYFKQLAEQRVDSVIETSPNGIVVLNEHLNIMSMNPAFRQFFQCSNAVCGKPISYLMDPEPFERLLADPEKKIEIVVDHASYHLVCHEVLYALPQEKQFVGVFMNITTLQKNESRLDQLREQTVKQARELLEQQIQMAETIASCLGENAARAESLLENLMDQAKRES